tara:strand:- start:190 stop:456 length:267 start_codon:yes stop_codon:yes gene_type:complete
MSEEKKEASEDEEQYTGSVVGFLEEASDDDVPLHQQKNVESKEAKKIVKAAPFVRALAKKLNVDLASVAGSGPEGRVTKEDVEKAAGK